MIAYGLVPKAGAKQNFGRHPNIEFAETAGKAVIYSAIRNLIRQPIMFDERNIFDPGQVRKVGFQYKGIGKS